MKNKCEYCDQKFAARCATIHEEKKYDLNVNIVIKNFAARCPTIYEEKIHDLNVNIVIKNSLIDLTAKQVLSSD